MRWLGCATSKQHHPGIPGGGKCGIAAPASSFLFDKIFRIAVAWRDRVSKRITTWEMESTCVRNDSIGSIKERMIDMTNDCILASSSCSSSCFLWEERTKHIWGARKTFLEFSSSWRTRGARVKTEPDPDNRRLIASMGCSVRYNQWTRTQWIYLPFVCEKSRVFSTILKLMSNGVICSRRRSKCRMRNNCPSSVPLK